MSRFKFSFRSFFTTFLGLSTAVAILAGFAIIFFVFSSIKQISLEDAGNDISTLSMIGEFFGGVVGSIWSLAGVILFYLALIYQRRELELQREELVETRQIMDNQSKTVQIQQFENTFFQLLEFHLDAAKNIESKEEGNGFILMHKEFVKAVNSAKRKRKKDSGAEVLDAESFDTSFRQVYDSFRNTLSHYMESYKSLLFFIEDKSNDPCFYLNIIKPHLTEQEVLVQFYYLLLYDKNERFKQIVEDYGLFERLNIRSVQSIDKLHLEELKPTAYQSSYKAPVKETVEETEEETDLDKKVTE